MVKRGADRIRAVTGVIRHPRYFFLFVSLSIVSASISLLVSIRSVIRFTWRIPADSVFERIELMALSLKAIPLNLMTNSIVLVVVIAVLSGLNITLLVYYFKKRASALRESSVGIIGMISGVLGLGCASCGSVLLSSFIGLSGSSLLLSALPLKGLEFMLLAIVFLVFSITSLSTKLLPDTLLSCDIRLQFRSNKNLRLK